MKWEVGRQGTGYSKLKLAQGSWWDAWLLHYPAESSIPNHTDPVPNKRHYRLNIVLLGSRHAFLSQDKPIFSWAGIVLFRPDINVHAVARVPSDRYVLSIGWVRNTI